MGLVYFVPVIILAALWGGVAAYNLARGFSSGAMNCFYGAANALAARDDRPGRFWTYAGVNLFIVVVSALILGALLAGMQVRP